MEALLSRDKPGEFVDIDKHIDEQYFCTT